MEEEITLKWFKEGLKVFCEIYSVDYVCLYKIKNAKLHYEGDEWYICQDKAAGKSCNNKLGYKYSWGIYQGRYEDLANNRVYKLRPAIDKELLLEIKKEILK